MSGHTLGVSGNTLPEHWIGLCWPGKRVRLRLMQHHGNDSSLHRTSPHRPDRQFAIGPSLVLTRMSHQINRNLRIPIAGVREDENHSLVYVFGDEPLSDTLTFGSRYGGRCRLHGGVKRVVEGPDQAGGRIRERAPNFQLGDKLIGRQVGLRCHRASN